jgi:hypothetical protein
MPVGSGMAFVLVQHLDPHHQSLLGELLSRHTAMTVVEARDSMAVVANRIFVIPPNATLTIRGGVLSVATPAPAREHRRPIDTFFASLAEDQGERAVSIVLSGTGSDGTLGVRKLKEHGGLTLAQADSDAAALSGMPPSAAATGLVDHIIPISEMPALLIDYQRHLCKVAPQKDADGTRPFSRCVELNDPQDPAMRRRRFTDRRRARLRVLVVEDQMIVAMQLEDLLRDAGYEVMGPVGSVQSAMPLAKNEPLDAAILDVNLDGDTVLSWPKRSDSAASPLCLPRATARRRYRSDGVESHVLPSPSSRGS